MTTKPRPLADRFWEKVQIGEPDECWLWIGGSDGRGYGQMRQGSPWRVMIAAHRVSYAIANGIDVGQLSAQDVIRHGCDNPPCVNPAHLSLGTYADNSRDMSERGRARNHQSWTNGRCINGHDVTDERNVGIRYDGGKRCQVCHIEYQDNYNKTRRNRRRAAA